LQEEININDDREDSTDLLNVFTVDEVKPDFPQEINLYKSSSESNSSIDIIPSLHIS